MAESKSAAASAEYTTASAEGAASAMRQPGGPLAGGDEALAGGVREMATVWARYAEAVMRHTSEASQALLRCQSFSEMLEVQARLLQGNMQAFVDQGAKLAEIAARVSSRSFDALNDRSGPSR